MNEIWQDVLTAAGNGLAEDLVQYSRTFEMNKSLLGVGLCTRVMHAARTSDLLVSRDEKELAVHELERQMRELSAPLGSEIMDAGVFDASGSWRPYPSSWWFGRTSIPECHEHRLTFLAWLMAMNEEGDL